MAMYTKMILVGTILSSTFFGTAALADTKNQALEILKKYNSTKAVKIKTHRTETKKTLGTTTTSDGELIYSKNRVYFVTDQPTKTEIIYNKDIWVIEYPDIELDENANRKVSVFGAEKAPFIKAMAEIFSAPKKLFGKDAVFSKNDDEIIIKLKEIKNTSLKELQLVLNSKEQNIKSISFIDDLMTSSVLSFEKTEFLKSEPKNRFVYKKLKTDEILKP